MPLSFHMALYEYWNRVRGKCSTPTRSDVDPLDIPRLLPFVGLIERRPDGYFWRLVGTEIEKHFGRNMRGERYGAHFSPSSFVDDTIVSFEAAFEQEIPIFDEFVYRSERGWPHAVCRLLCPLAADRTHPPIIIHTRLSRYERVHSYQLADNARGEMIGRHSIHSKEDIDRRTKEWVARASLPAAD
jgi:hypothetical protein